MCTYNTNKSTYRSFRNTKRGFRRKSIDFCKSVSHSQFKHLKKNIKPLSIAGYFYLLHSSLFFLWIPVITCAFANRVENSVDPDQLASQKPADLNLHCFQNWIYL